MLGRFTIGMKDGALGLALKRLLNDRMALFGEVIDAQVDTRNCRLQLKLMLKGETDVIYGALERYEIDRIDDVTYIRLKAFSCSREWLEVLLNQRFADKQFKLPAVVSSLL